MARPMVTSIGGLCRPPQVFEILFWQCQVLQAQDVGLLQKPGGVCPCECGAPPHGSVWAPHHRAEDCWEFLKQDFYICRHRGRNGLKFFRLIGGQNSKGGSNRDLVLLFAFAGGMPGVPFSCAASVKGFFPLSQRFGQVAPVSTKKLSFEISSFKKSKPAFVGNDMAVAAWTLLSAGLGRPGGLFSFPTGCKGEHTC